MQNLLNNILTNASVSHAQFAKDIEISKSYVLFMLNGQKPLTEKIYTKMLSLDYVAPYEEMLTELFFRQKFGSNMYELIQCWLENAKSFTFEVGTAAPVKEIPPFNGFTVLNNGQLTEYACALLRSAAATDTPLYTNYPFTLTELDEALYSVVLKEGVSPKLFNHTVGFSGSIDENALISYWRGLRWGYTGVESRCCFTSPGDNPLPYYIVSGDMVLMFSQNGDTATLTSSREAANIFISSFCEKKSYPFVTVIADEAALLTGGCIIPSKRLRTLENAICSGMYYDYDMLFQATRDTLPYEIKDTLIKAFLNYYNFSSHIDRQYIHLTQEAFEYWLKTGRELNVSAKYLDIFSMPARKELLTRINKNDDWKMIKKGAIPIPRGYSVDEFDSTVITHFLLTSYTERFYELFVLIPKVKINGLSDFLDALFCYIDLEAHVYSLDQRQNLLNQMIILGEALL